MMLPDIYLSIFLLPLRICFVSEFVLLRPTGITKLIAAETSQYAVCVPTGDNKGQDTNRGFFMTMDKNVRCR